MIWSFFDRSVVHNSVSLPKHFSFTPLQHTNLPIRKALSSTPYHHSETIKPPGCSASPHSLGPILRSRHLPVVKTTTYNQIHFLPQSLCHPIAVTNQSKINYRFSVSHHKSLYTSKPPYSSIQIMNDDAILCLSILAPASLLFYLAEKEVHDAVRSWKPSKPWLGPWFKEQHKENLCGFINS